MITSTTRDQVLTRLCGHIAPAEELARKDDLVLLFSAVTSWCPIHNSVWRRSAGEVLMTISRCSLTPAVVRYVHEKGKLAFRGPNIFITFHCDNSLVLHHVMPCYDFQVASACASRTCSGRLQSALLPAARWEPKRMAPFRYMESAIS